MLLLVISFLFPTALTGCHFFPKQEYVNALPNAPSKASSKAPAMKCYPERGFCVEKTEEQQEPE
jgi:hypothetical protein